MLNDQVPVEVRGASRDGAVDEGPVDEDFNLAGRFFPTPDMGALVTPGQFLLKSLNHPRTRTSKISAIHTAKMKLPKMQANHSRAPDMTIFGDVRAETRSLLTQVPAAQAWMEGVHDMERSKAARHDRAWRVYLEQRGEVEDTHRDRIASALQASRSELDAMGAELDRNCARLTDDEQLMMLDEGSVHGAWDDLNSVLRQREKAIAELGNLLEEEEARRRADQEALMLDTLAALMSIAHASEGAVERMMETEALEMNLALLRDRRAAASLLQRLKAREVGLEEQSRRTWEGSMERWRSLRTKHAIGRFVARIRSQEFAEPRERVEQLARARAAQEGTFERITNHVVAAASLPASLCGEACFEWLEEAQRLIGGWEVEFGAMVDDLEANEAAVEQRAQELKRELEGEVMALGFLRSGEACAARFDADVEPALRGRRDAARALLDHVRGYLEGQVRTWRKCIDALGGLLCDVGTAQDDHRAQVAKIREKNAYVLAMTRRAFEDSDKQVEEALAQAIRDIQEGSSERDLDQLVQVALDHLNSIEGSYRDFHSNMCSIVDALPRSIDDEFRTYHLSLCGKLRVNPKVETPGDAADADKKQSGTEQGESAAEGEAAQDKPADDAKPAEGEEGAEGEDAAPAEPPPPPEVFLAEVEAADGGFWTCAQDLYDAVILGVEPRKEDSQSTLEATESAEAPAAGSLKPQQSIQKQGSLKPQQSIQKQGSLKPQQSIRKQGSLKPQPSVKPGKKGEGVPAAVTEGVAEGAAEGEGEEEAPAADEGSKWADPPTLQSGEACLAVLTIPSERVRTALVSLTCSALGDMCQFTAEVNSEVAAWARKQAEDLTEELDELLRSHRPRAGLIEEDVRQQRSVKLLAQKRSVDAHLRGMGRSILAQCARFEGAVEERRHQIDRLLRRLRQQEGALNVDMSVKSVEIRVREAQQQQGVLERALEQACLMLSTSAEEDAARLKAVNERFAAEVLVPFEEGGEFAEANIRRYKAQLEDCNTVVRLKMEAQLAKVEELQKEMAASAGAAVEQLGRVAEVHKEDLALVEALDRAINAARSRADKIFSASEEHARRITQEIQTMRKLIRVRPEDAEAKFAERTPGPKLAAEGNHGGHELAQDLVDCSNRLRVLVASRGRTLDAVRDGIDIPVNLFRPWIEGENTEPPFEDDEDQNDAESEWTQGGLSLEKLGITREELEGVTVRVRVHELIERCHEQCAPVAQAYYESKDPERAITRPKRIPRELDELNEVNNRILNDIRGRLRRHLEESLLEFRDQIISINRQLLALPGAAARALIYHDTREYIRQAQKMDSRYASRQKQLRNELEQHRLAIRPQLGEPNCQPLVDELVEEESARAETSVESMKARARNSIEALSRAGPIIRGRLALLARGLARICDGIIVPGDLREARGDDEGEEDAVAAAEATGGLKRTMTQAAAAAVQAEASHSSVGVAQPGAPAPRTRMNIKQLKRLALAQADAGSGGTGQEANERGLVRRTWELEHGSISPGAIGWGEEDVSMARPLDDDDEDDEDEEEEEEDEGNVPLQVEGLDTPVHRACIRAYVQALETLSSAFRSIVDDVRSTLSAGLREEELFRRQFNKLVNTLQRSYV